MKIFREQKQELTDWVMIPSNLPVTLRGRELTMRNRISEKT